MVESAESTATLQDVFHAFNAGAKDMDNRQFAKCTKDCGLLDKKLTTTDVDLIFNKVKNNPSIRKINFKQFEEAVAQFATKKGISEDDVKAIMISKGGPTFTGTKADSVKFHDDKSTYTGTHTKGGPTTVDNKINDLSQLADRSSADVRGVKK
mmetsp:Transcript_21701/g.25187  ORF Transcript_21701/g.25187 Transcript_21701/m.25187 type:complete len:153 (-) Transcript_21701:164-622(-)|eukprot:CAMPEP_0176451374 /NCGR_PEP_ID=MMETSP0127-20121128/27795_1 /TAXON_ID=938130 /ORGANISM="Platyophrya macrostoma, Strain WH" /LENGTH=152 /DNA_ID=CAMNT_0017839411 /DNA_START=28 /DNA_END=486 /DNA_ORIENTATION=-